ncbi:DUF4181 domain-containing protein [Psychrobacillus sp. FSL H8-0483]|uniref:DUF4181 domain-containing protein n=1 Tax=Psychrobacillus sp. FSL H8-0483 TaxID=2921389 RepID=UPI00315A88B8
MKTFTIVSLLIVFAIYLFITEFYLKRRLKIKNKWKGLFFIERNSYSFAIDIVLIFLFIFSTMSLIERSNFQTYSLIVATPMFGLFFLLGLNRGLEEWLFHRDKKVYYYEWLGSFMNLITFFIILIGEQ